MQRLDALKKELTGMAGEISEIAGQSRGNVVVNINIGNVHLGDSVVKKKTVKKKAA